jgi:hypothetical protein
MKSSARLLRPVAFAAALVVGATFAGCNRTQQNSVSEAADKTGAAIKDAYNDTTAAIGRGWDNFKAHTWEKRDDFTAHAKALSSRMDAQLQEVRTSYSEATASASRKAAMEELKRDEADYKEKTRALGNATAATWDAAKQNVILAWDKLEASYHKARAN